MGQNNWVRELLRCPECLGELADSDQGLACMTCRVAYPLQDGVPGLLAHRAEPLEEQA